MDVNQNLPSSEEKLHMSVLDSRQHCILVFAVHHPSPWVPVTRHDNTFRFSTRRTLADKTDLLSQYHLLRTLKNAFKKRTK